MVSVIIPTYNEEKALPETLRALFAQPGEYEVIHVDGCSSDRTCAIARSFGFVESAADRNRIAEPSREGMGVSRLTVHAPKGRASQMNEGARVACGAWLLFLHADTILPPGAIQRLNELARQTEVRAGGFMHQFSGDDWRLKLISFLDNVRCIRSRIIYGDQALFVRRTLFEQLGGFPHQLILEDVAFCEQLIKVTTPILLSPPVITDARKFLKMGIWSSFVRVLLIILHVEFRLPTLPRSFFQDVR
jgi:rSAM/selenodomain-associated transferase 2